MTNQPLVSVLCLCYNQAQFIRESLDSIKVQSYSNFEIIICDDASKDNSVEIVEGWLRENPELNTQFIKHAKNEGICKSLNDIFSHSSGKYIQILALDDIILPDKLERHVEILENSKDSEVLVFSDALMMDEVSELYDNRFIGYHLSYLRLESGNFYDRLMNNNFIPAMSVLMKAERIKEEGGWDENLTFEDFDMWLRLSLKYYFIFDHTPSCKYRIHSNNTHKRQSFLLASYFDIYQKHSNHPTAKTKLFNIVEKLYFERQLKNEHIKYFQLYKPETFSERLLKSNKFRKLYKLMLVKSRVF